MKLSSFAMYRDNIEILENDINNHFQILMEELENRRQDLLKKLSHYRDIKGVLKKEYTENELEFFQSINSNDEKFDSSCLRFLENEDLVHTIKGYGDIDDQGAVASKSTTIGIGVRYAIQSEPTQFKLNTFNNKNELSWVRQDRVDILIAKDSKDYNYIIENKQNGVYSVQYELPDIGVYDIHVKVNGHHIPKSPFKCTVLEKQEVQFTQENGEHEWKFHEGSNSALLQQHENNQTSRLFSSDSGKLVTAWKVRVITACPKLTLKLGYTNNSRFIPDLREEFFCKINLNGMVIEQPNFYHHTYQDRRNRSYRRGMRKQSTFERSSLSFMILLDDVRKLIRVALDGTNNEYVCNFKGDLKALVPFIGIRHECQIENCPRPVVSFP